MEIRISIDENELQQLITNSVQKCLQGLKPVVEEPPDRIDIDEACKITGYLKPTTYKLCSKDEMPHQKFGKRLIFSRSTLLKWMESRTITKPSAFDVMSDRLAESANKRRTKS